MNKNVMKKMMMVGAMCVALCGSSFAGANQKMVVHSDKRQVQQHQMQQHKVQQKQLQQMQAQQKKLVQQKKLQVQQQKHVVKQKQVVVVQKYDKCRHNRHDCRECYRDQHCCEKNDRRAAGAALLGAVVGGLLGALAS